jgi:hypothetical protein
MAKDLVSLKNGHLVFGDAVSRVAESLSPLGAASRIVAESYTCLIAMREINLEGRRVENDKQLQLAKLSSRRTEASAALREMQNRVGQAELTAQDMRQCIVNMQKELVKPDTSLAQKKVFLEAIRNFGDILLKQHSQQGNELVRQIDSVLNGSDSVGPYPVPVNARQRGSAPNRARRRRR